MKREGGDRRWRCRQQCRGTSTNLLHRARDRRELICRCEGTVRERGAVVQCMKSLPADIGQSPFFLYWWYGSNFVDFERGKLVHVVNQTFEAVACQEMLHTLCGALCIAAIEPAFPSTCSDVRDCDPEPPASALPGCDSFCSDWRWNYPEQWNARRVASARWHKRSMGAGSQAAVCAGCYGCREG